MVRAVWRPSSPGKPWKLGAHGYSQYSFNVSSRYKKPRYKAGGRIQAMNRSLHMDYKSRWKRVHGGRVAANPSFFSRKGRTGGVQKSFTRWKRYSGRSRLNP